MLTKLVVVLVLFVIFGLAEAGLYPERYFDDRHTEGYECNYCHLDIWPCQVCREIFPKNMLEEVDGSYFCPICAKIRRELPADDCGCRGDAVPTSRIVDGRRITFTCYVAAITLNEKCVISNDKFYEEGR